jgi:hypothetical protein
MTRSTTRPPKLQGTAASHSASIERDKQVSNSANENLRIRIFSDVNVQGTNVPHLAVYARAGDDRETRIFIPATRASEPTGCTDDLLRAGLRFFDRGALKKELLVALQNVKSNPRLVATSTGWYGSSYVFNGEIFAPKEGAKFALHQTLKRSSALPKNDTLIDLIDEYAGESDYLAVAAMLAFAPPLLGLLPGADRPLIYFQGETTTGKTTLLKAMRSISAPPGRRDVLSADFTARAFEEILQENSDSLAIFDELTALDKVKQEEFVANCIYIAANGHGKQRSSGSAFPNLTWRSIAVLSGEESLDSLASRRKGSGQDARLIIINTGSKGGPGIWPSMVQAEARANLSQRVEAASAVYSGHSFAAWLRSLVRQQNEIPTRAEALINTYAGELVGANADGLLLRQARRFAQIAVTGEEMIRAAIVDWPRGFPFQVIKRLFDNHIQGNGNPTTTVSEIEHISRAILARIEKGDIRQKTDGSTPPAAFIEPRGGRTFVMVEKGHAEAVTGFSEDRVKNACKLVSGLLNSAGSTPYFQKRNPEKRYLRMDIEILRDVAFTKAIDGLGSSPLP